MDPLKIALTKEQEEILQPLLLVHLVGKPFPDAILAQIQRKPWNEGLGFELVISVVPNKLHKKIKALYRKETMKEPARASAQPVKPATLEPSMVPAQHLDKQEAKFRHITRRQVARKPGRIVQQNLQFGKKL
jgi:hypothetical protein